MQFYKLKCIELVTLNVTKTWTIVFISGDNWQDNIHDNRTIVVSKFIVAKKSFLVLRYITGGGVIKLFLKSLRKIIE